MLPSTARPTTPNRKPSRSATPTVAIVDPHQNNYAEWDELAESRGVRLVRLTSAEDALRFGRTTPVDLWVVNTRLPGLSGCELCSMLKSRSTQTAVYLVAEEYSPTEELAAWQARATLFLCQGADSACLAEWCDHRRVTRESTAAN